MLRHTIFCGLALFWVTALSAQTITFEDLSLAPNSAVNNTPFMSFGASFNNSYDNTFGSWSGWAYSNQGNTIDPAFSNQFSSFTGGGAGGSANFAVGYYSAGYFDSINNVTVPPVYPTITLPAGTIPQSIQLTNGTYPALNMRDGDPNMFAKKFGGLSGNDPDFFKVTVRGLTAGDAPFGMPIDFYLADYRFANNSQDYIVNTWQTVDLTGLAGATKLRFEFDSSDKATFGSDVFINTPTYVLADNLVVAPIPEPGVWITGALLLIVTTVIARRRSYQTA